MTPLFKRPRTLEVSLRADPVVVRLQKAAKAAQKKAYRQGMAAGVEMTLDQLEGRSKHAQGPAPELTDEIRDWIAFIRANLDQANAEDGC